MKSAIKMVGSLLAAILFVACGAYDKPSGDDPSLVETSITFDQDCTFTMTCPSDLSVEAIKDESATANEPFDLGKIKVCSWHVVANATADGFKGIDTYIEVQPPEEPEEPEASNSFSLKFEPESGGTVDPVCEPPYLPTQEMTDAKDALNPTRTALETGLTDFGNDVIDEAALVSLSATCESFRDLGQFSANAGIGAINDGKSCDQTDADDLAACEAALGEAEPETAGEGGLMEEIHLANLVLARVEPAIDAKRAEQEQLANMSMLTIYVRGPDGELVDAALVRAGTNPENSSEEPTVSGIAVFRGLEGSVSVHVELAGCSPYHNTTFVAPSQQDAELSVHLQAVPNANSLQEQGDIAMTPGQVLNTAGLWKAYDESGLRYTLDDARVTLSVTSGVSVTVDGLVLTAATDENDFGGTVIEMCGDLNDPATPDDSADDTCQNFTAWVGL